MSKSKDLDQNFRRLELTLVVAVIHKPVDFEESIDLEYPLQYVHSLLLLALLLEDVERYADQ